MELAHKPDSNRFIIISLQLILDRVALLGDPRLKDQAQLNFVLDF